MTEPHFPQPYGGRAFGVHPLETKHANDAIVDEFDSGAVGSRERWSKPRRSWRLIGKVLKKDEVSLYMGFIRDRANGSEPFYWDNIGHNVWDPYDAPDLDETSGGTKAQRTYYVAYTFSDGTGETLPSAEDSLTVSANYFLTVTVPHFPAGVTEARIYVGTATGVLYYSGKVTTSGGTWTEDETSTTVDADSSSGQKILYVTATSGFQVGGTVLVNSGGPREELCVIESISAGDHLVMEDNLQYTHLLSDADAVATVVGNALADAPPTTNDLAEEVKVLLVNNPEPVLVSRDGTSGGALYDLTLEIVELFS